MDAHPANIEAELVRLTDQCEPAVKKLAQRSREAAEAEVAYRVAKAKAFLLAEGTMQMREAIATVATESLLLDRKIKEALVEATRESCRMLREQLGSVRSINANARQAAGLS